MAVYKEGSSGYRVKNKSTIKETYYGDFANNLMKEKLEDLSKMFNNDIRGFLFEIRRVLGYLLYHRRSHELLSTEYKDCLSKLQSYISDYVTFIQQLTNMSQGVGYATNVLEKFDAGQLTAEELYDELNNIKNL